MVCHLDLAPNASLQRWYQIFRQRGLSYCQKQVGCCLRFIAQLTSYPPWNQHTGQITIIPKVLNLNVSRILGGFPYFSPPFGSIWGDLGGLVVMICPAIRLPFGSPPFQLRTVSFREGKSAWFSGENKKVPSLKLTAKAPENGWLEYYFPIGEAYFQGRTVSFREGTFCRISSWHQNSYLGY